MCQVVTTVSMEFDTLIIKIFHCSNKKLSWEIIELGKYEVSMYDLGVDSLCMLAESSKSDDTVTLTFARTCAN